MILAKTEVFLIHVVVLMCDVACAIGVQMLYCEGNEDLCYHAGR